MTDLRLMDVAHPIFKFAATFPKQVEMGYEPNAQDLKEQLLFRLRQMDGEMRQNPSKRNMYNKLRYGLVGLIDEVIINSRWSNNIEWISLEPYWLGSQVATDRVYEIIENLNPDEIELRECFFYVLSLGFRGKFISDSQKWLKVQKQLASALPVSEWRGYTKLTPETYQVTLKRQVKLDPRFSPLFALLWLLLIVSIILTFHLVKQQQQVEKLEDSAKTPYAYIQDAELREFVNDK